MQVICRAYFVGHCLKYSSESTFSWEARKVIPSWGCGDREYVTSHLSKGQLLPLCQARFLDSLRQNHGLILLLLLICSLPFFNILRGRNVTKVHHTEFTISYRNTRPLKHLPYYIFLAISLIFDRLSKNICQIFLTPLLYPLLSYATSHQYF